jgi:uncharacterized membrane protein
MNKKEFLESLFDELVERDVKMAVISEIVNDHDAMISEAVEHGMLEEEFIAKLGRPSTIARTIARMEVKENGIKQKLIATTPFISLIVFFILGLQFDLWHPGWLVFMLVPISGVVLGARLKWNTLIVGLSPFISIIFFILFAYFTDIWHPTWLVFFIIPVLGLMFEDDPKKKYIGTALFTIIPLVYLYLELTYDYQYSWLVFGILLIGGYWLGYINITISGDKGMEREMAIVLLVLGVIYALLGIFFNWWHPAWIIFLIIPAYAMLRVKEKIPLVAYSPFVATALFIIIGELFNVYQWAWIVFLIIPLMGIFTDSDSDDFDELANMKPGVTITVGGKELEDDDDEEII